MTQYDRLCRSGQKNICLNLSPDYNFGPYLVYNGKEIKNEGCIDWSSFFLGKTIEVPNASSEPVVFMMAILISPGHSKVIFKNSDNGKFERLRIAHGIYLENLLLEWDKRDVFFKDTYYAGATQPEGRYNGK
jgi:hypothetical protein